MLAGPGLRGRAYSRPLPGHQTMPHPSRIYPTDEELGKRNDDYRPKRINSWLGWRRRLMEYRRKRIVVVVAVGLFVWLLWTIMPGIIRENPLDVRLGSHSGTIVANMGPGQSSDSEIADEPKGPPPRITDEEALKASNHYFNGPIRFFRLADSLHAIAKTLGHRAMNKNVMFAVANLKSAATLLPLACEMVKWNHNFVHFAIMGREGVSIEDLKEINAIDGQACFLWWHDARPDYSQWSTDNRMGVSVSAALGHINQYMHPQIIIVDGSSQEDNYFLKAITSKSNSQNTPVLQIPAGKADDLRWITRLDSGALRAWYQPSIDILIQAPPKSTGPLIRLLKSLERADYDGIPPPRLTIDLPPDVDVFARSFFDRFVWPPRPKDQEKNPEKRSQITFNRRINQERLSPEDNAVRFVESFYPNKLSDSHVLLLTPQAEVSPRWYHYIYYEILQHRYSPYQPVKKPNLAGIALERPATLLDGLSPVEVPGVQELQDDWYAKYPAEKDGPFLWQAPNANAALYFGEKWAELQSFLSNRIAASNRAIKAGQPFQKQKMISITRPAWTEYMLELMRARSYALQYPTTAETSEFVIVHSISSKPAEEFNSPSEDPESDEKEEKPDDTFIPNPKDEENLRVADSLPTTSGGDASQAAPPPLHNILPFEAELPELPHIPMLSHDGHILRSPFRHLSFDQVAAEDYADQFDAAAVQASRPAKAETLAREFAQKFRHEIGGCTEEDSQRKRKVIAGSARDLFCFYDEGADNQFDSGIVGMNAQGEALPATDPEKSWAQENEGDLETELVKDKEGRLEKDAAKRVEGLDIKLQDIGKPGWDRKVKEEEAAGGRAGGEGLEAAVAAEVKAQGGW
ncbi:MAG: hypothetical protein M1820_001198 [Bogoriella megaspora]|nr:MAG: hypothetical protein M1820_001198 [Bogoriella megaspora]